MEDDSYITPEIAEYPEAGPYWVGLWAVAQHWVAVCAEIFEPGLLASPGITRRFALRCCNWLWAIEGLVRRLIIAAAMKFDVSQLAQRAERKPAPPQNRKPAPASVTFAVLPRIRGRRPHIANAARLAGKPPGHRHIAFPGDALLQLFPRHDRRNARPASRRSLNPLHRRGRPGRWDPDYKGPRNGNRPYLYRDTRGPDASSRERTHVDRFSPYRRWPDALPEWKRLEQEWERIVPAPRLAGRISALLRVMQAPERWIARAARRLNADLRASLRSLPPPKLKKPKLDKTPPGFLEEPLAQSHALLDTS